MKVVRINVDGTMNDLDITSSTKKNIISKLNKSAISKGDTELKGLYRWSISSNIELLCYGWYDGSHGFENKHELPPNGISDFLDDEDDSAQKLLFGDIFLTLFNNKDKVFVNCVVSDYGRYYEELFEGFDECNTSDENEEEEDETLDTDDEEFIDDKELDDDGDSDFNSDEQLDIDDNTYTSEDESDYDEACEGESDGGSDDGSEDDPVKEEVGK